MEAQDDSQLVLQWQQHNVAVTGDDHAVLLGAADCAHLQVAGEFASRQHAHIKRRKQDFVLVDHSTNGTYVQTEDERIALVHRAEMRLWGAGWISLGEPLSTASAIRFHSS